MKAYDLRYRPAQFKRSSPLQWELERVERKIFTEALKANKGVLRRVAAVLGLHIITARKRAIKYGLWPWKG